MRKETDKQLIKKKKNRKFFSGKIFFLSLFLLVIIWWSWRQPEEEKKIEKEIELKDDQLIFEAKTSAKTVAEFLKQEKFVLNPGDLIYPGENSEILFNQKIKISRPQKIFVEVDGQVLEKKVFSSRLENALNEAGILLAPLDKIQPGKNEMVTNEMKVVVTRIEVEEIEEEEKIPFEIIEKNDADLVWRKKEVKQRGEMGVKKIQYKITYKNGKQVSKEKLSQKIEKKPITEIVAVGTKVKVGQTKVGVASWYVHTGTMTCASRIFPKGTWLRVTNRENGKQIFVVVDDYGPMRGTGKMIDLDKVAFEKIASLSKGVVEVKVEQILEE